MLKEWDLINHLIPYWVRLLKSTKKESSISLVNRCLITRLFRHFTFKAILVTKNMEHSILKQVSGLEI